MYNKHDLKWLLITTACCYGWYGSHYDIYNKERLFSIKPVEEFSSRDQKKIYFVRKSKKNLNFEKIEKPGRLRWYWWQRRPYLSPTFQIFINSLRLQHRIRLFNHVPRSPTAILRKASFRICFGTDSGLHQCWWRVLVAPLKCSTGSAMHCFQAS